MSDLNFLFEAPTVAFRAVNRKGELRYIASLRRGSLAAITRFAPPTKPLPRLYFGVNRFIDFRFPGVADAIEISERFLSETAARLGIPIDRVGIYVGEPNERQKMVVADVENVSKWVLKIALGNRADEAILQEKEGLERAVSREQLAISPELKADSCRVSANSQKLVARGWNLSAPSVREVEPIYGRSAILIERVKGRQLTPEEFERVFFGSEPSRIPEFALGHKLLAVSNERLADGKKLIANSQELKTDIAVEEWLYSLGLKAKSQQLEALIDTCRSVGALEFRSPLGVVHGDFAPWNVLRTSAFGCQQSAASHQTQNAKSQKLIANGSLVALDWECSRPDTPLIFDHAYAAWSYSHLLHRRMKSVAPMFWKQLVSLGALWKELRLAISC